MVIIFSAQSGHPLVIRFEEGDQGIPTFDTVEDAWSFLGATDAFGTGWEVAELPDLVMADVLERFVGEVEHVVLSPPPQESQGDMTADLVGLERYVDTLRTPGGEPADETDYYPTEHTEPLMDESVDLPKIHRIGDTTFADVRGLNQASKIAYLRGLQDTGAYAVRFRIELTTSPEQPEPYKMTRWEDIREHSDRDLARLVGDNVMEIISD